VDATQLLELQWKVLCSAGLVSLLFGVVLHRSHFCTMGAVSDAVIMGNFQRLRQWALALAVAILIFGVLCFAGLISPLQSFYATNTAYWLSACVGGLLFGWGMVWASGCGSKSLVRFGAGNLKSLVVLLVMGGAALITLKGALALPRVNVFEAVNTPVAGGLFAGQWLISYFHNSLEQGALAAALLAALLIGLWVFKDRSFRTSHNVITACLVGVLVGAMWWVSGVLGHGLEHPETLEEFFVATSSRKMEAFSLTAPMALGLDALMYLSDGTKRFTIGMVSVLGICLGAFLSAKQQGTFRLEGFSNPTDMLRHLVGASLMGVGAVMAMGCSIGQGLSGLSTLNVVSLLATLSILAGAYLALLNDLRSA
jgi:uncharacterized membrane protein YedE/YeeE